MDDDRQAWARVGRVTGFGLTAAIAMLCCGALGLWLDRKLGTTPVFTSILFLSGGGCAVWYGILNLLK
jgi:uncharacterized membrane protein YccC